MSDQQDSRYQGWRNYETWCVKLWLDNDYGLYTHVRERVEEIKDELAGMGEDRIRFNVADFLKDLVEEMTPDLEASMFSDLLNAALSEVDWDEIAENILSEA